MRHGTLDAACCLVLCSLAAPVDSASAQTTDAARVREAAIRGFAPIQAAQKQSLTKQACAATCHLQVMGAFAYRSMREHGLPVDEPAAKADAVKAFSQISLGLGVAVEDEALGEPGIGASFLVAAHAMGLPPTVTSAAFGRAVALAQQPAGDWTSFHIRAPSSYSSFTFTAYGLRATQLLAHPSQKQDVAARVTRARRWLESHEPKETEERTFQLLGLSWAGADKDSLRSLGRALAATQRSDGGWNSLEGRDSEAYSTGQALVALHDAAGMPTSDPVYQRGIAFLLRNQAADGSWHVTTRLPPWVNPPYFESGYPYGRDQFISVAGANWAVMALTRALGPAQPLTELPLAGLKAADVEPWVETVMFGSTADLKRLLDGGFDPNASTARGGIPALTLAMPDVDKARLLIDRGAAVDARSGQRHYSALMIAAQYPDGVAAVRFLLERGASVGVPSGQAAPAAGASPLFFASVLGSVDVLPLLRDRPQTLRNTSSLIGIQLTPLAGAALFDRIDWVRALIQAGADVNELDGLPLVAAVLGNRLDIARLLIASGADVNRASAFPMPGTTVLHLAAYIDQGDDRVIRLLLESGARPEIRGQEGLTALDVAEKLHNAHLIPALRAAQSRAER